MFGEDSFEIAINLLPEKTDVYYPKLESTLKFKG